MFPDPSRVLFVECDAEFFHSGPPFCCVHVVKPIQLPLIILLWSFSISKTDKSSNNGRFQFPGRLFLVLERSENSLVAAYWWQFDWVDCNGWWSNEFFRQTSSYLSTPFNSRLKTSNQRSIILFYAAWMCNGEKERSQIDTHHFIINEALLMWQRKSLFRVFSSIMHAIFSVWGLTRSTSLSAYWTPSSSFLSLSPPLSLSLCLSFYLSRSLLFVPIYINSWNSTEFLLPTQFSTDQIYQRLSKNKPLISKDFSSSSSRAPAIIGVNLFGEWVRMTTDLHMSWIMITKNWSIFTCKMEKKKDHY